MLILSVPKNRRKININKIVIVNWPSSRKKMSYFSYPSTATTQGYLPKQHISLISHRRTQKRLIIFTSERRTVKPENWQSASSPSNATDSNIVVLTTCLSTCPHSRTGSHHPSSLYPSTHPPTAHEEWKLQRPRSGNQQLLLRLQHTDIFLFIVTLAAWLVICGRKSALLSSAL